MKMTKRWLEETELHCAAAQSLQEEEASRSCAIAQDFWENWDFSEFSHPEAAKSIVAALMVAPAHQGLEDLVRSLDGYGDHIVKMEVADVIHGMIVGAGITWSDPFPPELEEETPGFCLCCGAEEMFAEANPGFCASCEQEDDEDEEDD